MVNLSPEGVQGVEGRGVIFMNMRSVPHAGQRLEGNRISPEYGRKEVNQDGTANRRIS